MGARAVLRSLLGAAQAQPQGHSVSTALLFIIGLVLVLAIAGLASSCAIAVRDRLRRS